MTPAPKLYRKIAVGSLAAENAADWTATQTIPAAALDGEGEGAGPIYTTGELGGVRLGQVGGFFVGVCWLNGSAYVDDAADVTLEAYFTLAPKDTNGVATEGVPASLVFSGGEITLTPGRSFEDFVDPCPSVAALRVEAATAPGAATHLAIFVQEHGR